MMPATSSGSVRKDSPATIHGPEDATTIVSDCVGTEERTTVPREARLLPDAQGKLSMPSNIPSTDNLGL